MTIPVFGQKDDKAHYISRYGVYAIIPNPQATQIILVQAPNGAWFLPGGEIEEGEDHATALARELMEELGFTAQIGHYYGQADEYFYSSHRDKHFHNPAYIYEITHFEKSQEPLEDFNRSAWFPINEARAILKRGSHRWGIDQWKHAHNQT